LTSQTVLLLNEKSGTGRRQSLSTVRKAFKEVQAGRRSRLGTPWIRLCNSNKNVIQLFSKKPEVIRSLCIRCSDTRSSVVLWRIEMVVHNHCVVKTRRSSMQLKWQSKDSQQPFNTEVFSVGSGRVGSASLPTDHAILAPHTPRNNWTELQQMLVSK